MFFQVVFIVSFSILSFIYLMRYMVEKLIWVAENQTYIIKLIDRHSKKVALKSFEECYGKLKDITETEKQDKIDAIYTIIYCRLYKSIKIKNLFPVAINPFATNINHLVGNRKVLGYLIEQDK